MAGCSQEESRSEKRLKAEDGDPVPMPPPLMEPTAAGGSRKERNFPRIMAEHPSSKESKWFRKDLQVGALLVHMQTGRLVVHNHPDQPPTDWDRRCCLVRLVGYQRRPARQSC